jgi:hypothetical protein
LVKVYAIFLLAILATPAIVPAVIFYQRHCNKRPRAEDRLPLGLYVVALLICAVVAFWGGIGWGVHAACTGPSSGNLCGLWGFIIVGPLSAIIAVSVLSWLITYFPRQMKRLVLAEVLLFLLVGGYFFFRAFFFDIMMHRNLYQYTLQSGNLDELHRVAPVVEAQMRRLPALKEVSLDSQLKSHQAIVNIDPQKAPAPGISELPMATITISFRLAPGVALGDAIAQIQDIESRLALPATITTSWAKAPTEAH